MGRKKPYPYAQKLLDRLEKEESLKGKKPEVYRVAAIKRIEEKLKLLKQSGEWDLYVSPEQKTEIRSRFFQSGLKISKEEALARLAKDRERKRIQRAEQLARREKEMDAILASEMQRRATSSKLAELLATQVVTPKTANQTGKNFLDDLMEKFEKERGKISGD